MKLLIYYTSYEYIFPLTNFFIVDPQINGCQAMKVVNIDHFFTVKLVMIT
jgi:hypothetical protein